MLVQILSVSKKNENDTLPERTDELRSKLDKFGYTLTAIKKTLLTPVTINMALNAISKADDKPDVVIIANALDTKNSKSFKKYFVETVVAAEKAESDPAPKEYWKNRNKAFAQARKEKKSKEELEALEQEFVLTRKKAKVFPLGEFGNDYTGYCFMYRGVKVAAVPKAELTGRDFAEVAALAAVRTNEVFENSAEEYKGGFSELKYVPEKTGFVNNYIPKPGDSKKEIGRKCLLIAAFLVFLGALAMLFYNTVFLSAKNAQLNGEVQRIAHETTSDDDQKPEVDEDGINWDKLKEINDEIVGWIKIDNTVIDYPVLWHKEDNMNSQYYLSHNYQGGYDSFGSIFLDYRSVDGTDSKNVIMHGHHMNDGSMFGNLLNYGGTTGNLDFYKESPTIEFDTPEANGTYKIISVFKTNTLSSQGEFFNYMIGEFENEKAFMNYVYNVRIRSLFNIPVDVNEDDELITLSTCSYEFTNFRTVIVARRVRDGESEKVDVSKATLNSNAVWPDVYYSRYGGTRPTVTDFCTAYEAGEIDWYNGDYDFKSQTISSSTDSASTDGSTASSTSGTRATEEPTTEATVYLTVKFINYDGSEISTQQVEYGKAATAPDDPVKPSDDYYDYVFKGWQLEFDNVTADMTIAPNFEPVLKAEYAQGG